MGMSGRFDEVRIDEGALARFHEGASLADRAHALHLQQQSTWELARRGFESLAEVQVRGFEIDGSTVRLQFNPGRMRSSSAKVDAASIGARPCFLCVENLPDGQRGIPYGDDYLVLVNPFPIFPEHFTIPSITHAPQRIGEALVALLDLGRDLSPRYTVFYNGPRCGASAPDHLHFQAGTTGFMPLDREFPALRERRGEGLGVHGGVRVTAMERIPCRCVVLEGDDRDALAGECARLLDILGDVTGGDEEPMVNIVVLYDGRWRVVVIPRARHRPSCYAADGEEGILLSPASVDLCGVCITPREEDFRRIGREQLAAIFAEVCLGGDDMRELKERLRGDGNRQVVEAPADLADPVA